MGAMSTSSLVRRFGFGFAVLAVAWLFAACERQAPTIASADAGQPDSKRQIFQVRGVIKELQPEKRTAVIKHEEIPGYMIAMTMPFQVRDAQELAGLAPGDPVTFRMVVIGDEEAWIEELKKVEGPPVTAPPPPTPHVRVVRDVEPLDVGDLVPDYRFTDQDGRAVSLKGLRGNAVALTFIFTRCPYPDFCPRMSREFAEAQRALLARANAPANWRLLSLSFDPDYDTPATLKAYAARQQADPARWSFLTGTIADIDALTEQFGLSFTRDASGVNFSHNLRTAVIDAAGRVQRILVGNQWQSSELVEELVKAAQAQAAPSGAR